jgi:cell fate (sporulation/competence/biofilm development) regulator YlbF (YheA/YmcA/DUF963 family)
MLEEKAKELGRLIGQSSEYQSVRRANEQLNADKEAMAILAEMEQLRARAEEALARGEQPPPEIEQKLDALLATVQSNGAYQRVVVSQENFDKLMSNTNAWILDGIRKGSASPIITLG